MSRKHDLVARPSDADRQLQELWLVLAKREWTSLAILPADEEGTTDPLARSLADVGKNLSDKPVSAVTVKVLGTSSARALVALANHVRGDRKLLRQGRSLADSRSDEAEAADGDSYLDLPPGRLIVGIPSVISTPVSLAVTEAVDLVVLGVQLGTTSMKGLKRSIELIGRDRIAGCVLI